MIYEIDREDRAPQPVLSIRVIVSSHELSQTLADLLRESWMYIASQGMMPSGPPFARYHHHLDGELDVEAGWPMATALPPLAPGTERIATGTLPGGMVAVTRHIGSYQTLDQAYVALETWIREHGYEPAGPPWEVYWTDPAEEPDPGRWQTEVIWPIH